MTRNSENFKKSERKWGFKKSYNSSQNRGGKSRNDRFAGKRDNTRFERPKKEIFIPDDAVTGVYAQGKWDFGFVDVEGKEKGYYVFWRNSNNAMAGDTVIASVKVFKGKEEAEILKIVSHRKDPIVWIYKESGKYGFVVPNDKSFKKDIFVPGKWSRDAKEWEMVAVEVKAWDWKSPEWKITRILWNPGDQGVDILAIAVENWARMWFGKPIHEELEKIPKRITKNHIFKRKDLRKLFTITIDGADSKDLDDAISIEVLPKGDMKLYVHIADVTHYVKEGHAIDKEALRRATSIYLVNQVIPMLPEALSNGLCSLNPHEEKLTMTAEIVVNSAGHIKKTKVYESIISSDFRMTYKEVDQILNVKNPEIELEKLSIGDKLLFKGKVSQELVEMLGNSEKLRNILAKYKKELWVLSFDFPETKVEVDEAGNPIEFKKYPRYHSNKIIEECMILANEAVSKEYCKVPFLYRTHAKPSEEDVEKLFKSLAVFSYKVPVGRELKPKDVQIILDEIKNNPKEKLLSKMVLRCLSKAIYSPDAEGHFGLALDYYSHFTSPIRRYPDLQIHRIIKEKIHGKLDQTRTKYYKTLLEKVAKKSSDAEVKAEKLEYKIRDLMAVKYMKSKIWEEFDATVSGTIGHGVFVELPNTVEGFVELNDKFGRADYDYDAELFVLTNRVTGKKFTIGDALKVKLKSVDEELLQINFELSDSL